ncbi:MAG: type II toxin-antitoxin system VapC family toxin [bacterium]
MKKRKYKERYALDSFAVLTYLKEEPGWQKVKDVVWAAFKKKNKVFLNYVNLGEVYYIVYREYGAAEADRVIGMIKLWPLQFVGVKEDIAIIAGRIKAENKLSYADAYVMATALTNKAVIMTGDPEFKCIEDLIEIDWLPKNR